MSLSVQRLGEVIADVRKVRGLTQRAVAEKTGLTINYLSLIETGARSPSFGSLNKIAEALDVSTEWLVFLSGGVPPGRSVHKDLIDLHESTQMLLRAVIKEKRA